LAEVWNAAKLKVSREWQRKNKTRIQRNQRDLLAAGRRVGEAGPGEGKGSGVGTIARPTCRTCPRRRGRPAGTVSNAWEPVANPGVPATCESRGRTTRGPLASSATTHSSIFPFRPYPRFVMVGPMGKPLGRPLV
jgi:hypothetical protein